MSAALNFVFLAILVVFINVFYLPATLADEKEISSKETTWLAHIVRSQKEGAISKLILPSAMLPVVMINQGKRFRPMVEISLTFDRPGWKLLIQGTTPVTPTTDKKKYKVFAYINSKINELLLVANGPEGVSESEKIYIYAPEAQEFNVITPWDAMKITIGSTYLSYKQTGFDDFYSWSGLLSVQLHSPEESSSFGLLGEINVTALTVSSNQNKYGPQLGQGILDGIYFFKWDQSSIWRIQAIAGVNYITMFSNGAPFGFKNLISPELGVRARRILDAKSDLTYEFRFLPMNSSFDLIERGFAASVSKSWILANLHRGEAGLKYNDFSYRSYRPEQEIKNQTVSCQTLSFILSYSF